MSNKKTKTKKKVNDSSVFFDYEISPIAMKDLNDSDLSANAWRSEQEKMSKLAAEKIDDEFISFVKENGIKRFIPHGVSVEQALSIRLDRAGDLEAILCDYDGCTQVPTLRSLIIEARDAAIAMLLCIPALMYGGIGSSLREGGYVSSPFEDVYSVAIYSARHDIGQWSKIIIDYKLYAPNEQDDYYGRIHELLRTKLHYIEKFKAIKQYTDFSQGKPFTAENELYIVQADDRMRINNENTLPKRMNVKDVEDIDTMLVRACVRVLNLSDIFLAKDYDKTTQVENDIDEIRSCFFPTFHAFNELNDHI